MVSLRPFAKMKPINVDESITGIGVEAENGKFLTLKCSCLPIVGQIKRFAKHRPISTGQAIRANAEVVRKIHLRAKIKVRAGEWD